MPVTKVKDRRTTRKKETGPLRGPSCKKKGYMIQRNEQMRLLKLERREFVGKRKVENG